MNEDPRELARRLAEEAKQRLQELESPAEDPRALARRLAEEAKQRMATDSPAAAPTTASPAEPALADRATGRPLTAAEALERARSARQAAKSTPARTPAPAASAPAAPAPAPRAAAPPNPTPVPLPPAAPPPPAAAQRAAAPPATAAPIARGATVDVLLSTMLPGAQVISATPVTQVDVFRALWRSHLARGQHDGDPRIVSTAAVLLEALDRVAGGNLVAVKFSAKGEQWAGWVDVERSLLLSVAQPADVYLAGV